MKPFRSLICLACTLICLAPHSSRQQCHDVGWLELTNQERWHQADIVVFGKDTTDPTSCPPRGDCDPNANVINRKFSHFEVHCIFKNNPNVDIPRDITIEPERIDEGCVATTFDKGETGWLYVVKLKALNGSFYWDEINNQTAITGIYSLGKNDRLIEAARVCNLNLRKRHADAADGEGCPVEMLATRENTDDCFIGCPRGWKTTRTLDSCYWMSGVLWSERLTQNEAAMACSRMNSRVISLGTEKERDEVTSQLLTPYKKAGLDMEWWSSGRWVDGGWRWMGEESPRGVPFGFFEWRPGEPSGGPQHEDEDAVAMVYSKERWGWRDVSAATTLPYICEKRKRLITPQDTSVLCSMETDPECRLFTIRNFTSMDPRLWISMPLSQCSVPQLNLKQSVSSALPPSVECLRWAEEQQSVADILFHKEEFNPYTLDRSIQLTVNSPAESLSACHLDVQYADQVYTASHPYNNAPVPAFYLRSDKNMKFVWNHRAGTSVPPLYTLVLVDLGLKTVNGLWVNAVDSSLKNSEVLMPYTPIIVPSSLINNALAVILFEQRRMVNTSVVDHNYMTQLFDDLDLNRMPATGSIIRELALKGPVAMTVLPVKFDLYSVKLIATRYSPDVYMCYDYFYKAVPAAVKELIALSPDVVHIKDRLDVSLGYKEAFEYTVCCQTFTYSSGLHNLSPLDTSGQRVPYAAFKTQPDVFIRRGGQFYENRNITEIFKGIFYSLAMVEHRHDNLTRVTQHNLKWMVTNIQDGDVHNGNVLFPYILPGTMRKDENVVVSFLLFQQEGLESDMLGKVPDGCTKDRCPFDLRQFVELNGLRVSAFSWVWITWDRYVAFQQREYATVETSDFCKDITTEKLHVVNGAVVCTGKSSPVSSCAMVVYRNAKVWSIVFLMAHVGIL